MNFTSSQPPVSRLARAIQDCDDPQEVSRDWAANIGRTAPPNGSTVRLHRTAPPGFTDGSMGRRFRQVLCMKWNGL